MRKETGEDGKERKYTRHIWMYKSRKTYLGIEQGSLEGMVFSGFQLIAVWMKALRSE